MPFCRFCLHMKIAILLAVACNMVLSMDGLAKLDEDSEVNVLGFLDKDSRFMYAATSKGALGIVKKHWLPIDNYLKYFGYSIQVANGCITGNKLRGFDPVDCIKMITEPKKYGFSGRGYRLQTFTNAQLDILIFNAIEIGNIPVLDALLQIRSSKGAIEFTFLQDAFCWALLSKTMHRVAGDQGFDFSIPSSIAGLASNRACKSLNDFASSKGHAINLSTSVTIDMVAIFRSRLVESNRLINTYFYNGRYLSQEFADELSHRPYPTSQIALHTLKTGNRKPFQWLGKLLEVGILIQEGAICAAVNSWDTEYMLLYFRSGMRVNWDSEMKCISRSSYLQRKPNKVSKILLEELDLQYLPKKVPHWVYHGAKDFDWLNYFLKGINFGIW